MNNSEQTLDKMLLSLEKFRNDLSAKSKKSKPLRDTEKEILSGHL
jgi:hypothetical protein